MLQIQVLVSGHGASEHAANLSALYQGMASAMPKIE
jgi:hypothetical protein